MEKEYKASPKHPHLLQQLNDTRNELQAILISNHEKYLKLKLNHYSQGNKEGKLLAFQLLNRQNKQKIHKIIHHKSGIVLHNPQIKADAFAEYYEGLYNLKEESIPQPQPLDIIQFINKIKGPYCRIH